MKKVLLKRFLVCILIVMIVCNFLLNVGNVVYAEETSDVDIGSVAVGLFSNVISGLVGVLLWPITAVPTAILIGISDIIGGLARLGMDNISSYGEIGLDYFTITPFHILFNKIPLVDINFFDFTGVSGSILQFREAVAGWYYTMRLISSMVLLVILVYLGVRMALTSIATEKAIYKKMLVDWVTSLALLFLLHYIMLFIFACNNALVDAMEKIARETKGINTMMTAMQLLCFNPDLIIRISAIIIYGMLVFQTISFLVSYIKRMFTIGFLIIIAPLITITYSIDKIGDGKAQALNTWLKEFSYNILLQPFQCILYLVFAKLAYDSMVSFSFERLTQSNIGVCIFAILCLQFIKEGEKIIKKIFGFGKANTVGDLAVGAAMTAGAIMKGKDIAKKYGGAVSKTKNRIASSPAGDTMRKYFNSDNFKNSKVGKAANALSNAKDKVSDVVSFGYTANKRNANSDTQSEKSSEQKSTSKKQRATSNTKLSSLFKNSAKKIDESTENLAKKTTEKGKKTDGTEKNQDKGAKSKKDSQPKAKKDINGAKGNMSFGGALAKASGEAISGIRDFAWDHKQDIRGMTVGMFTAGIGLATGDFGDISKGVAGYNMGKGFTEGIYAYSSKELTDDMKAALQLYANMTGIKDIDAILANAEVNGLNELSKMIRETKKDIENMMKACKGNTNIIGEFNKYAIDKKKAGTLTPEAVGEMLDRYGFKESEKMSKEDAIAKFANLGELLASQTLYKDIQNAEAMEIDRETLAQWLGGTISNDNGSNVSKGTQPQSNNGPAEAPSGSNPSGNSNNNNEPTGTPSNNNPSGTQNNSNPAGTTRPESPAKGKTTETTTVHNSRETSETHEYEEREIPVDINDIAERVLAELSNSYSGNNVDNLELGEIQGKISDLNKLIEELNQKNPEMQETILTAINDNNQKITNFDNMVKELERQRDGLQNHLGKFNGQNSNNGQGN